MKIPKVVVVIIKPVLYLNNRKEKLTDIRKNSKNHLTKKIQSISSGRVKLYKKIPGT